MSDEQLIRKNQSGLSKRSESLILRGLTSLERIIWTIKQLFEGRVASGCISPSSGWFGGRVEALDETVILRNFDSPEEILLRAQDVALLEPGSVHAPSVFVWSPCGNYLATGDSESSYIIVYSLRNECKSFVLEQGTACLHWSVDGNWLLSARAYDERIQFLECDWDLSRTPPKLNSITESIELTYSLVELLSRNDGRPLRESDTDLVRMARLRVKLDQEYDQQWREIDRPYQDEWSGRHKEYSAKQLNLFMMLRTPGVDKSAIRAELDSIRNDFDAFSEANRDARQKALGGLYARKQGLEGQSGDPDQIYSDCHQASLSPDGKFIYSLWRYSSGWKSKSTWARNFAVITQFPSMKRMHTEELDDFDLVESVHSWSHDSSAVYVSIQGSMLKLLLPQDGGSFESKRESVPAESVLCNPACKVLAVVTSEGETNVVSENILSSGGSTANSFVRILNSDDLTEVSKFEILGTYCTLQWSRDGSKLWILTPDGVATQAEIPARLLRQST